MYLVREAFKHLSLDTKFSKIPPLSRFSTLKLCTPLLSAKFVSLY